MPKISNLLQIPAIAAFLRRIGAEPRSLQSAVVKEQHGAYWHDVAVINFSKEGKVEAPPSFLPTEQEAKEIEVACATVEWPQIVFIPPKTLPKELNGVHHRDIFEFYDIENRLVMLQHRLVRRGEKSYIPYTFWDDGEWRRMEPEGKLPVWGANQLKEHSTVFIHAGAKAARNIFELVNAHTPEMKELLAEHPWGEELSAAAHIGWIGGALTPHRTDWSVIKRAGIKRAYIVSDNDAPGLAAVPHIAQHLRIPTFHIQFTNEWPASFDLGDEFPENMFKEMEGKKYYIGPSFRSCLHPATWATDQIKNDKGKPTTVLRKNFKDMWAYVEEADIFVCTEMPEIVRSESIMNKMLSAFSHSNQTSQLIVKAYTGRSAKLCYRPDINGKFVTDATTSAINLHTPTHVKSMKGNPQPFLDFMEYMFPNPKERHEAMRWCATLIAKPAIRMEYGLLLVSERQGVGKTTLGTLILAPLVGRQNVSFPTETLIVQSEFNGWLANKRLIVVNEIYSGHSWKAYNKLKSIITDKEIETNEKYQRTYTIENWAHIFACSNSKTALKVEEDDRRWFYPEVTEEKWSKQQFTTFRNWVNSGGLSIIKHWAENFKDYVYPGESAPMTESKKELIVASRTEGQQEAAALAEAMARAERPVVLTMKDVVGFIRQSVQGRVFDTDLALRKTMKESGAIWFEERFVIGGRLQYACMNSKAWEIVKNQHEVKAHKGVFSLARNSSEEAEETKRRKSKIYDFMRTTKVNPNDISNVSM